MAVFSGLLGASATIFAAAVGVLVVFWQIGRQARHAIEQQQHNERLKLKLDVYRELAELCGAAVTKNIEVAVYVQGFVTEVGVYETFLTSSGQAALTPPPSRFMGVLERYNEASNAITALATWIHRWQIIDPRVEVFATAMAVGMHESRAAYAHYTETIRPMMPRDLLGPQGRPEPAIWYPPRDAQLAALNAGTDELKSATWAMIGYVEDLQREMQTLLVGELFGNRLKPRLPGDPGIPVVTLDRHEALAKHFETNTEWGRNNAEVKAELERRARDQQAR